MREGREDGNSRPGYRKRGSKRKGLGMERKRRGRRWDAGKGEGHEGETERARAVEMKNIEEVGEGTGGRTERKEMRGD